MAAATLPDWVQTQAFSDYVDLETKLSSKLISSGAMVEDAELADFLRSAGDTVTLRFALALTGDSEVSDDSDNNASPAPVLGPGQKVAKLIRNKSFAYKSIIVEKAASPTGGDPARFAANKFGSYWGRESNKLAIKIATGVLADNAAAPTGTEHVQNDMTYDASGASFTAGVTDFSIANLEFARAKMGESMEDLVLMLVHPTVAAKFSDAVRASLIDRGVTIVLSGDLPVSSTIYDTWLFSRGALRYAIVDAEEMPYEVSRNALIGQGGGQTTIITRKNLAIAPAGTSYVGSTASGQPTNTTLAAAASWARVWPERAQIGIGRLKTREA